MADVTPYRRLKEECSDHHPEEKSSPKTPQPQPLGGPSTPVDRPAGVARNASDSTPGTRRPYRPCVPKIPLGRKRGYHALTVSDDDIVSYMGMGPAGESPNV